MPLIPVTRCATPNEGEGCGRTFPRKTQQGLCKSCEVMDKAEGEDRARKEVSTTITQSNTFIIDSE